MSARLVCFAAWATWTIAVNPLRAAENLNGVEGTRTAAPATEGQRASLTMTDADLLRRVQVANEDLYASLRSFVCDESVVRTRESLTRGKTRKVDTLTTRVSFENGQEQYTDVRQNNIGRSSLSAVGGAWSEGEFGTLLRQTQQLLRTQQVRQENSGDSEGAAVAFLNFAVSQEDSPWILVVEGRSYKLPFRTEVAVERSSGHILSVKREATQIPRELCISGIEWAVNMGATDLAGSSWLLPIRGEYAVSYLESNRRERNEMTFGNYRRYGSEVALRFDPVN